MKKILAFLTGWLIASLFLVGFFAFISWGESPETWDPVNRFMVALLYSVISIGAGVLVVTSPKNY